MSPQEKALRVMWHRWGGPYSFETFGAILKKVDGEAMQQLREFQALLEDEIAGGRSRFCDVCETLHPEVRPGQELLVPKGDQREQRRVVRAHLLDEVKRSGEVPVGVLMARLRGEVPS